MKIHYTGKLEELSKDQKKNLENHFAKLGKLVDRKGEREAHVVLTAQRHTRKAEVTMNYYGVQACGSGLHKDQFIALLAAIDKLEKQLMKARDKWLDAKRHGVGINGKKVPIPGPVAPAPKPQPGLRAAKVQRATKPMTIEEAPFALKTNATYMLFEEQGSKQICILVRRGDGGLDLIEAR